MKSKLHLPESKAIRYLSAMGKLFLPITLISLFLLVSDFAQSQTLKKIVIHREWISTDSVGSYLSNLNVEILNQSQYFHSLLVNVDSSQLDTIRKLPWIYEVNDLYQPITFNYESRVKTKAIYVQSLPWGLSNPYNLSGSGVNVSVCDLGHADHSDFVSNTTEVTSGLCDGPAWDHSNNVCGTIAGQGNINSQHAGFAPGCHLYTYSIHGIPPLCQWSGYWPWICINDAVDTYNATISNNSWGWYDCYAIGRYGYGNLGASFDEVVRNKDVSTFFSAGNFRYHSICNKNYFSISSPGTSKNVITVGAIDENNNIWINYTNGIPDAGSSIGPTIDGRLKPDLVAPGVNITTCTNNNGYTTISGTSSASAAATGIGALLIERFKSINNNTYPKPDLLKAILINTAKDLGNPGPDYIHGYGLINSIEAVSTIDRNYFTRSNVSTNQIYTKQIQINHPCVFKVSLVWSDKEGYTTQDIKDLINDLDIKLIDPNGQIYYPWTLDPSNPSNNAIQNTANHRDNVEQVYVSSPVSGLWTIQVSGNDVPFGSQDFALVWSEPTVPDQASNNSPIDIGDPINIIAPLGGVSYNWSGPNGFSSTNQNISISQGLSQNAGIYTVTVTYSSSCSFTSSTTVSINPNLSGWIRYKDQELNTNHPLNNTAVHLLIGSAAPYNTQTNTQGIYSLAANPNTYDLLVDVQNPFTVPNSLDALLCAKYYISQVSLTPFQLMLGDVDGNTNINATDALLIMKRFIGTISSWAGNNGEDWYYEQYSGSPNPITIQNNQTYTSNFSAACMGDVNFSNYSNYNYPKKEPQIILQRQGELRVKAGIPFKVNVVMKDSMVVGSISLVLTIPSDSYNVDFVTLPETCDSCQFYYFDQDQLKIAWYNITGTPFNKDKVLLTLHMTANEDPPIDILEDISIDGVSEITDTSLHMNPSIELVIPKIVVEYAIATELKFKISPNPTKANLNIEYDIPEEGFVDFSIYDIFGRQVLTLNKLFQTKGAHKTIIDVSSLPSGAYSYKISFPGAIKSGKIIIAQ